MQATISIHRFKVYSHHGVMQQERTVGGWFYVSLDVVTDVLPSAYLNDSLDGTVNYARLAEVIAQEMEIPSNLLEHVAHRLAHLFPQTLCLLPTNHGVDRRNRKGKSSAWHTVRKRWCKISPKKIIFQPHITDI